MPEVTSMAKHLKGKVIEPNSAPLGRMDKRSKSLTIAVNDRLLIPRECSVRFAVRESQSNEITSVGESYAGDCNDEREEFDHVARLRVFHAR